MPLGESSPERAFVRDESSSVGLSQLGRSLADNTGESDSSKGAFLADDRREDECWRSQLSFC